MANFTLLIKSEPELLVGPQIIFYAFCIALQNLIFEINVYFWTLCRKSIENYRKTYVQVSQDVPKIQTFTKKWGPNWENLDTRLLSVFGGVPTTIWQYRTRNCFRTKVCREKFDSRIRLKHIRLFLFSAIQMIYEQLKYKFTFDQHVHTMIGIRFQQSSKGYFFYLEFNETN